MAFVLYALRSGAEGRASLLQVLSRAYGTIPGGTRNRHTYSPKNAPCPGKEKASHKRRELKPEEQIARLRSTVRWLYLLLVVAVLAFSFIAAILLYKLNLQGTLLPW